MFKRNLKKAVTLMLVASMMVGAAAGCGKKEENGANPTPTIGLSTGEVLETQAPTEAPKKDDNQGTTDATPTPEVPATYTYNLGTAVFPTNWNPHASQTSTDSDILNYISDTFYKFDYNETLDGYKLVPGMAVGDPVDVTADYVGKYGIEEGDKAQVWKLTLRQDLKWEDGTPIKAHDFVTSAKLLLDPVASNYRADSLYSGNMAIYNAKNYFYQGQYAYSGMTDGGYVALDALVTAEDGTLKTADGKDLWVNLEVGTNWDSSNSLSKYYSAGYQAAFVKDGVDLYETVLSKQTTNADGYIALTADVVDALKNFVAIMHGKATAADYEAADPSYAPVEWNELVFSGETYAAMDFAEVGVFAPSDYELVLAIEQPLEGFYLLYALDTSWLVKEDLYNSCITMNDGVYNNTYGTSVETTASYGPYKLTTFQADKQYVLSRNDNYYGITDTTYQTTAIQVDFVAEASTRLEMLLSGKLDSYGLSVDDMAEYQSSDYTYYTSGASTFFMALNPDMDALKAAQEAEGANINKTILTIKEFRQALSFALDRAAFALACDPTAPPAFAVYNSLIISDPDKGESYRSTPQAKKVLADFWGLTNDIGEGKMYPTIDDALESITGYNLEMGKQYFDKAYDIAIAEGLMDADDVVSIKIGVPASTYAFYKNGNEFLVNCYTEAVKGTKLEGKLQFSLDDTLGNGFSDALKANQVDMLFGVGWTGMALDPYGLMEAYTSESYQYDPSWNTKEEKLTISIEGTDYTATVWDWTLAIMGDTITIEAADGTTKEFSAGSSDEIPEIRLDILAALEGAVLATYDLIPMTDDASANLKGMQIEYYTEDYVYGIGRGGYKYMTYNYTDAEWDEYVASQGGTLNYK